jgi:hypothetical protein
LLLHSVHIPEGEKQFPGEDFRYLFEKEFLTGIPRTQVLDRYMAPYDIRDNTGHYTRTVFGHIQGKVSAHIYKVSFHIWDKLPVDQEEVVAVVKKDVIFLH